MLKKKRFSLLMFFIFLFTVIPIGAYADDLPFTDVSPADWFYNDVKAAYTTKLINGKTSTLFAPNDNMTAAEAVKLAACIHQLKNEGKVDFTSGNPWYLPYVDYAKKHKLLSGDLDWNNNITRAGYMQIFAQILSDDDAKKNKISDNSIPDVPMSHPNAPEIYKMYRAGIVQGVDAAHSCNPASVIKRSEVAAIVMRMTDSTRCISFNLDSGGDSSDITDLTVTKQPNSVKGNVGEIVTLEVEVKGGKAPLKYQWQHKECGTQTYYDSKADGNKTNILKPTVESKNHDYICKITDANGNSVNSAIVTVFTDSASPIITKQPIGAAGKLGEYVKLEVIAEGGKAPLKYQWQYAAPDSSNFQNSKAKGNTSNILEPQVEKDAYDYRCVITDANGKSVISDTVRVTKKLQPDPLVIIKQPEGFEGNVGDTAKLEVIVEGGKAPLKYLWKYNEYGTSTYHDSKAPGNMSDVLRPRVEEKIYDYHCVIIDADGKSVKSNSARVQKKVEMIDLSLKITKQPPEYVITTNDNYYTASIETSGTTSKTTYQWYFRPDGLKWIALPNNLPAFKGVNTETLMFKTASFKNMPTGKMGFCDFYCEVKDGKSQCLSSAMRVFRNPQKCADEMKPPVIMDYTRYIYKNADADMYVVNAVSLPNHNLSYNWQIYQKGWGWKDINDNYTYEGITHKGTDTSNMTVNYANIKNSSILPLSYRCIVKCKVDGRQVMTSKMESILN